MKTSKGLRIKIGIFVIVISFAIIHFVLYNLDYRGIDSTFLILLFLAVLIPLIPWEKLTSFKAGGIELTLEQTQIKGALSGITGLDRVEDEQLRTNLSRLLPLIEQVKGSRILWIDDQPHNILGVRRLIRALGIEVVSDISSKEAKDTLIRDNDFDLIISDVQRKGESYKITGGIDIHEGVNFIVLLRKGYLYSLDRSYMKYLKNGKVIEEELKSVFEKNRQPISRYAKISKLGEKNWAIIDDINKYRIEDSGQELHIYHENSVISSIPVIFYGAYSWDRLVRFTSPARELYPEAEISNSVITLVPKLIQKLSEIRSSPSPVNIKKKPTRPT